MEAEMKKMLAGLGLFVLIAVFLFALLLLFEMTPYTRLLMQIKRSVDVMVGVNDEGAKTTAFLQTKTPSINIPDKIATLISGDDNNDNDMKYVVGEMEIVAKLYIKDSLGNENPKMYGGSASTNEFLIDVPLPGCMKGKMGVFLGDIDF